MKKRKKREMEVSAPLRPTLRPEEIMSRTRQKDLQGERFEVLELARKIGKKFGLIPIVIGSSILVFLIGLLVSGGDLKIVVTSSPEIEVVFVMFSIFLGVVNIVTGLFLMSN